MDTDFIQATGNVVPVDMMDSIEHIIEDKP